MNKKILLINPPDGLEETLGKGKEFVQKYEPLGLLYIGSLLQKHNFAVSVIDAHAEQLTLEKVQSKIKQTDADIIGISTLTCNGQCVFNLGKWIKLNFPSKLVVLGNIHASIYAKEYLENGCCDIVVHGEGEQIFLKIVQEYKTKNSLDTIDSISFLDCNGKHRQTPPKAIIKDLDSLPFPARDLVDQSLYGLTEISNQLYVPKKGIVAKTMSTSRGCANACLFCVVHSNKEQRFISPNRVVDEMQILQDEYNASYVTIIDPLFMANKKRVMEICSQIKKRKLPIKWGTDAHVKCIDEEIIKAMESAGCHDLSFGIESGVQKLLDAVNKNTTIDQIKKALNIVKKSSKIKIGGLFILGLPGERYKDSLETIKFAKSLPLDIAQFSILTPYPGSYLFNQLKLKGLLDTGIKSDGSVDPSVWQRYSAYVAFNQENPIWTNGYLSNKQLIELQKRAIRSFYIRPTQIIKNLKRIKLQNIFKIISILKKGFFK